MIMGLFPLGRGREIFKVTGVCMGLMKEMSKIDKRIFNSVMPIACRYIIILLNLSEKTHRNFHLWHLELVSLLECHVHNSMFHMITGFQILH